MDPWIAISLGLAVVAIVLGAIAIRGGRQLTRSHATIGRLRSDATKHEQELAHEAAEQGSLLAALGAGVVRVDPGLRVVATNAAAYTLLGRAPGSLIGRSLMEAFLDAGFESMAHAALTNGTARTELRRTDVDGPTSTDPR